jgi:hypothetical protein
VFTVEIINPGQFRALARGWSAVCAKINLHLSDYASGKFISVRFPFVLARAEQLARSHEMSFTLIFLHPRRIYVYSNASYTNALEIVLNHLRLENPLLNCFNELSFPAALLQVCFCRLINCAINVGSL